MLVPTAAYVYQDALPDNAMRFDEDEAFEEARSILGNSLIDLRETMSKAAKGGQECFFGRTITGPGTVLSSAITAFLRLPVHRKTT